MRVPLTAILVLAMAAGLAVAEGEAPPAAPPAAAPAPEPSAAPAPEPDLSTKAAEHETVAAGTLPPLAGRWLVMSDLDLNGRLRGVPAFWEIEERDGKPQIVERFVNLPPELTAALEAKNTAGEKWEPAEADLAALRAAWNDLPDQMRGVAHVRNELWGKDAFTDEIRKEAVTKDAAWVIRQTYQFVPGGNRPVRQVNVFAVSETTPFGFAGKYDGAAVAVAPFPIPIPFKGTFRLIRLDPEPQRGFLARLGDMFRGCGR